MGYRNIMAAVDLTEETEEILAKAREMAKHYGAELSLLTVVRTLTQAYGGFDVAALSADTALIERDLIRQAEAHIRRHGEKLGIPQERCLIGHGSPAQEIKRHASTSGIDLIVMGTHGRHGLGLLLGSTATGVLHGAPCDVLTIRIREPEVK
jgi:universal stress protein A